MKTFKVQVYMRDIEHTVQAESVTVVGNDHGDWLQFTKDGVVVASFQGSSVVGWWISQD